LSQNAAHGDMVTIDNL